MIDPRNDEEIEQAHDLIEIPKDEGNIKESKNIPSNSEKQF